jgi:arylsulfatase A-like enzyme
LVLGLLAGSFPGVASGQERATRKIQPNILVIVLDDVGTDKLAMYGESNSPQYAQPPYCGVLPAPLPYPPTPTLDSIAAGTVPGLSGGGVRFDQAYAAPVCCPSRACLNTGRYGLRNGLGVVDDGGPHRQRMNNSEVLLAELLRQGFAPQPEPGTSRRYRCGAFGKWHMSALPVCDPVVASDFQHAVQNGFHVFSGLMGNPGVVGSNPGDHFNWTKVIATQGTTELLRYEVGAQAYTGPFQFSAQCSAPGTVVRTTSFSQENFTASVTRADAVAWINEQSTTRPFFAYVNFNAPHFPYQLPPFDLLSPATQAALQDPGNCGGPYCAGQEGGTLSSCGTSACSDLSDCASTQTRLFYNALLEAVDTEIGNLLAQIDPIKLARTMVFVVSDNGTPAVAMEPALHDTSHSKGSVFEGGVRVPMLASGFLVPAGAHDTDALVHAVDLWRTLAQISGADENLVAPLAPLDSISFRKQLTAPGSPAQRTEVFTQGFSRPGAYQPTSNGPYEPACQDPETPGVYAWSPKVIGEHGRSLRDSRYKLIVLQTVAAQDGLPQGSLDSPPQYIEMLFDLELDPDETTDLIPQIGSDPGLLAVRNQLRARMTEISGY